jgi:hypothetical protein
MFQLELAMFRSSFSFPCTSTSFFSLIINLPHYATGQKVLGSIPCEVIKFFSIDLILPTTLWPWGRHSL